MYDPERHHRRSIRLKGCDYSQVGAYFITIVTQDRACVFGEMVNGEMWLNDAGQVVQMIWKKFTNRYSGVETDVFVVMPNHIHGIILITETVGAIHESPLLLPGVLFSLDKIVVCGKFHPVLGDRSAAGRRVLAPLTEVRILVPQPDPIQVLEVARISLRS